MARKQKPAAQNGIFLGVIAQKNLIKPDNAECMAIEIHCAKRAPACSIPYVSSKGLTIPLHF
jgi:hypothetical protein